MSNVGCKECGIVDDADLMHPTPDGRFVCHVCLESKKVWDRWRNGELTHEQVQQELTGILPLESEGFFRFLEEDLRIFTINQISESAKAKLSMQAYFDKLRTVREGIVKSMDWVDYWQNKERLTSPEPEDHATLHILESHDLKDYHLVLCHSLRQFVEKELEDSNEAKTLYEFYKLTKAEINRRPDMPKLPETDAFKHTVQHKDQLRTQADRLEEARRTGEFCPYCDSINIKSDGHSWQCRDCKKYWRKRV